MTLTVGQVTALTVKGIDSEGGVRDSIFKNHAYLSRLKEKQGIYSGEKKTFPFNYLDDTSTTGSFYVGPETLALDFYDPMTELSFDLVELQETLLISGRDLARNSGKEARISLIASRLELMETAARQRLVKGIFSDGTASEGASANTLNGKQFPGVQAFLSTTSTYGGIAVADVSTHIAYVNSNSGTNRALTTALHQATLGGCSEGEMKPSLVIGRQATMDQLVELLKPHQRTTRDGSLGGLGHAENTLVYSGIDHIVDNLSPANSFCFINEKVTRFYVHPEYDMKRIKKDDLDDMDATMQRLLWKGVYANSVRRYNGWLKDITV